MNGKIDGLPLKPQHPASAGPSPASGKRDQAAPPAADDTVDITPSALSLRQAEQALAAAPVVDHGRVDAIRQALSDGTYRIDAQRVADRLLQSDQALGKPKP